LFVPRELAPDLTVLTGQILRQREDKGSSLRFETAETYDMRHGQAAETASQKMRTVLEKGREVLKAGQVAQAERERIEAAQLRQAEELKRAEDLKYVPRPRGPSLGM
jgi:hypothetical protein